MYTFSQDYYSSHDISLVDTIDGNVEAAYSDVIHGNQQLEKGVRLKVKCLRLL